MRFLVTASGPAEQTNSCAPPGQVRATQLFSAEQLEHKAIDIAAERMSSIAMAVRRQPVSCTGRRIRLKLTILHPVQAFYRRITAHTIRNKTVFVNPDDFRQYGACKDIPVTRLILIRHGETDYSLQNRYCGFSNPSLNNKGIWQSKKLADGLGDLSPVKVYSSDLKRAYETAKIIFRNNSIEKVVDLREMNFGLFEGLKYEEIVRKYPKLYRDWVDNPEKIKIPNGESLSDLRKRVKERLSFILSQQEGKTLAVVTHGGPIRVILCDALKSDLNMFRQIGQKIGALNIIDYAEESSPVVVKMNDTSYLSAEC